MNQYFLAIDIGAPSGRHIASWLKIKKSVNTNLNLPENAGETMQFCGEEGKKDRPPTVRSSDQTAVVGAAQKLALSKDKNPLHLLCIQNWSSEQI